jgi:hypothetical protein
LRSASRVVMPFRGWQVREPNLVVLLNMQVAFERVREQSVAVIEIAEIGAIDRLAREDSSRDRGEHMAGVRKW